MNPWPKSFAMRVLYLLVVSFHLSCSRRSIAENTVTNCYFEGTTNSGKTIAVQWKAAEHRCWGEGGWTPDERRPSNAPLYGQCGASLFQKELKLLKTQTRSIASECTFPFDSDILTVLVQDKQDMTVSLSGHEPWVTACSTSILKDDSDGNCSSASTQLRLVSIYKDDLDIFYVGSCYSGLRQEQKTYGTYDVYDSVKHYWTFDKESQAAVVPQEDCLSEGHTWKAGDKKYLNDQQGQCIQNFSKGLVVTAGDSDFKDSFICADPVEIFRISN